MDGDFNGDGRSDLVIGTPFENVGSTIEAGAVTVVYGASGGLRASALNQTFTQSSPGIYDDPEAHDYFGYSLATGDFNGDGYGDLAIAIPNEDFFFDNPFPVPDDTYANIGGVEVVYGSAGGLDPLGLKAADFIARNPVNYDSDDRFGFALAAANFGNGGPADLAVGSPLDDTEGLNNGTVSIFYGHTSGIDAIPSAVFDQSAADIPGDSNDQENFGAALAAGDLGKSGHADLAIGVANDSIQGTLLAGSVNVLYGSTGGLVTAGSQRWTQNSPGIGGTAEQADHFGSALAVGDFGRSTRADLAVSAPCEGFAGVSCAGAVHVIFGTKTGLGRDRRPALVPELVRRSRQARAKRRLRTGAHRNELREVEPRRPRGRFERVLRLADLGRSGGGLLRDSRRPDRGRQPALVAGDAGRRHDAIDL